MYYCSCEYEKIVLVLVVMLTIMCFSDEVMRNTGVYVQKPSTEWESQMFQRAKTRVFTSFNIIFAYHVTFNIYGCIQLFIVRAYVFSYVLSSSTCT